MIKWPEIQYVEVEDGILDPILEFPKQPEGNVGKYGNLRREYLAQHSHYTSSYGHADALASSCICSCFQR